MNEKNIFDYLIGGIVSFLVGIWIYTTKKVNDIPEKYIQKSDFREFKEDFKTDIREVKESIKGIHDRLDNLIVDK